MWYGGNKHAARDGGGEAAREGHHRAARRLLRLIQAHPKVLAVLTGDEHNYNKTRLDAKVPIYPPGWDKPKVELKRPSGRSNNGAAGAPY